jgi:tetratricopeptide (TPR) repeat protein
MSRALPPPNVPSLQKAAEYLQKSDYARAETVLQGLLGHNPDDANALHLLGVMRVQQQRPEDAVALLTRSVRANPAHAITRFNLGKVLVLLGRDAEAIDALRAALKLQSNLAAAHLELGNALHRTGTLAEAEASLRTALALAPGDSAAKMALGAVLVDAKRFTEAIAILEDVLKLVLDETQRAKIHKNIGLAQRGLQKDAEALESFEAAFRAAPHLMGLDILRAGALEKLHRYDETLAMLERILAAEPHSLDAHRQLNSLLYRLDRKGDFLKSFDRAPASAPLLAAKAGMLMATQRYDEALAAFSQITAQAPDAQAALGSSLALSMLQRHAEAVRAGEAALAMAPDNPAFLAHFADILLRTGDAERAVAIAARSHALNPLDQTAIALMGAGWRILGDERDEALNGYDGDLVRIFDLEPPKGWSSIESFNAELADFLDRLHPDSREYFDQSLRGGTQTPEALFGAGHALVEKLRERISEAVNRYIRELPRDDSHPLIRRRRQGFRFSGSWSSRLKDCGFHVNHVHSEGWISSCYYVRLPVAVQNEDRKEGWINFGQAAARPEMAVRRAVQPVSGRLILFPSFTWHGTNPFHEAAVRTTIAFDVVPD